MALVSYHDSAAEAFVANRHLTSEGLRDWRKAVSRHLRPAPGMRLLDLGAGTGHWANAFVEWFDVEVVAVEPSPAMRARSTHQPVLAGDADTIPLQDASVDAAWLSTTIHHFPDLTSAARELRRVVRPGGTVLIRQLFPGRHEGITLFRFWPEAVPVLDSYPSVTQVTDAFHATGFTLTAHEPVRQVSHASLSEAAAELRREAHTPLQLIDDDAYAAGRARLRGAAASETGPVVDTLDLLVFR